MSNIIEHLTFSEYNAFLKENGYPLKTKQEYEEKKAKLKQEWEDELERRREEERRHQKARRKRYDNYMNSPEWDRKRKLVLKDAGYKCQGCDAEGVPLQVHHLTYRNFMRERRGELIALCETPCHKIADRIRELYIKGVMGK
jgi:hypothetical protein